MNRKHFTAKLDILAAVAMQIALNYSYCELEQLGLDEDTQYALNRIAGMLCTEYTERPIKSIEQAIADYSAFLVTTVSEG